MSKRFVSLIFILCVLAPLQGQQPIRKLAVPLGGNSWITKHSKTGSEEITENGWRGWSDSETVFSVYFYLSKPGTLVLSAAFVVPAGESSIVCTVNGTSQSIKISGSGRESKIGEWTIAKPGYTRVDIQGLRKTGPVFATVKSLLLSGSATDQGTAFVKNNEGEFFHWGRRGPSVHLNYDVTELNDDIEWMYSEITVPDGNDVIGSYFMANGFDDGYFGIQVNSATERRVLFSVWSPFETDDPKKIPLNQKILLLRKGKNVTTGEFGNEGSGGQSYLGYNWKARNTYKFLIRAQPVANNHTNYSAWFYAPEEKSWRLIASFSRPATHNYLSGLYSFLENFEPESGNLTRKAFYQNQWVRTTSGEWKALNKATFTYDDTAKRSYRLDYSGGVENGSFYLRNCGFFNDNTPDQSVFSHAASTSVPNINLSKLE
jgi:uncharacterized protein DUF3472/uncharacterized protein DUF5077